MKKNKTKQYIFASAFAFMAMYACNVPDDTSLQRFEIEEVTNPETIAQHVIARPELSLFEEALRKVQEDNEDFRVITELNIPGNSTLFAPSNAAITEFLDANGISDINDTPVDDLTDLILKHIVVGEFKASDLTTGYIASRTTKTYEVDGNDVEENVSLFVNNTEEGISINRDSNVITADIDANNGVIHVLDQVIGNSTMASLIGVNPTLSAYLSIVRHANVPNEDGVDPQLEQFLRRSTNSGSTVFVPSNEAVTEYLNESGAIGESLQERILTLNQAEASRVVRYHQLNGTVVSDSLSTGIVASRLSGSNLTINAEQRTITDERARVANINTTFTDIHALNGVLHVIDRLLLPAILVEEVSAE